MAGVEPDDSSFIVPIDLIDVPEDRQRKTTEGIEELAGRIAMVGLLQPIVVNEKGDRFELVAGFRRISAHKLLGAETIRATLKKDLTGTEKKKIELEENLHRSDLSWPDRLGAIRELHELMVEEHGIASPGTRTDLGKEAEGWRLQDTADALGVSVATVHRAVQLAEAIDVFPSLAEERNASRAEKKYKKMRRVGAQLVLAQRAAEEARAAGKDEQTLQEKVGVPADLHNVNALVHLVDRPDAFDFIIADLPWGINLQSSGTFGRSEAHKTRISKDHTDLYDDSREGALQLMEEMVPLLHRALKKNRHMVFFFGESLCGDVLPILSKSFGKVNPVPGVWNKMSPGRPGTRILSPQHELFYIVAKNNGRQLPKMHATVFSHKRASRDAVIHASQKPVALMQELIETFTFPEELVFDPTFGSGSSLAAAIISGRRAEGCEMDETIFAKALDFIGMTWEAEREEEDGD